MNANPNGPWGTGKIDTDDNAEQFVRLPEQPADFVTLSCSVAIEVRHQSSTDGFLLPAETPLQLTLSSNLAEVEVRPVDAEAEEPATVTYLWRKANP